MVLVHGEFPKGTENIASLWANNRNVPQIGFAPDWTKHGRAAPFKRNDEILDIVAKGVMHFPAKGINDNLAAADNSTLSIRRPQRAVLSDSIKQLRWKYHYDMATRRNDVLGMALHSVTQHLRLFQSSFPIISA